MPIKRNPDFKTASERIERLMHISGLELSGFAEFTGVSESHIYAILNGRKELTEKTADKIANHFYLKGAQLLNPNFRLTKKISDIPTLAKFYKENKGVHNFFITTRVDRKVAHFIEKDILTRNQFNSHFTVSNVRDACFEAGRKYTSKRISQVLNYFLETGKLKSKKDNIIKKDGTRGKRLVVVFYKVKN